MRPVIIAALTTKPPIVEGSTDNAACQKCGRAVWLAPESLDIVTHSESDICCTECVSPDVAKALRYAANFLTEEFMPEAKA